MYSFCAMYSFRMSFWMVPGNLLPVRTLFFGHHQVHRPQHASRRVDGHRDRRLFQLDAANRISMSSSESMATPHLPTSPSLKG